MPNHETNNVVIIGEPAKIRRFVDEALVDHPDKAKGVDPTSTPEKILDFQRIIPMPEILGKVSSPVQIVETQEEADRKNAEWNSGIMGKLNGGDQIRYMTVEQAQTLMDEHGVTDWYGWSTRNWGTKWNAYSHSHYELRFLKEYGDDGEIYGRVDLRFDTAWSQPRPIFEAIEKRWGVKVHAVTQDEGGFPDMEYGDPYDKEVIRKVITHEFDTWHEEVDEPEVLAIEESTEA